MQAWAGREHAQHGAMLNKRGHPMHHMALALWYTASGVGLNMLMRSTVP